MLATAEKGVDQHKTPHHPFAVEPQVESRCIVRGSEDQTVVASNPVKIEISCDVVESAAAGGGHSYAARCEDTRKTPADTSEVSLHCFMSARKVRHRTSYCSIPAAESEMGFGGVSTTVDGPVSQAGESAVDASLSPDTRGKLQPRVALPGLRLLWCNACKEKFDDPDSLGKHIEHVHRDGSLKKKVQCGKCLKKLCHVKALLRHTSGCWKDFKVAEDGRTLITEEQKSASQASEKTGLSLCEICSKMVIRIRQHRITHLREKHVCQICSSYFDNKIRLASHHRRIHAERNHACPFCGTKFYYQTDLKRHLLSHGQRTFMCQFCPQTFHSKPSLSSHLTVHTDSRPYECDVCHTSFKRKSKLKEHKLVHQAVKPFQCPLCPDRQFTQKNNLNVHMMSHNKETNAHDNFIQSSASGKGPYKCCLCPDRVFNQKGNLRIHINMMHSDK